MALKRKIPSPISNTQPKEHQSSKKIKEIILKLRKDMDVERNFDFRKPIDHTGVSLPSKKRNRFDPAEEDQHIKNFITAFTDPILDEAADEVAEELEWELILQQWDVECENFPCLIID